MSSTAQVVSVHKTLAKFTGLDGTQCPHMAAPCPDCRGGLTAQFEIQSYRLYEALGDHPDSQRSELRVPLRDAGPFAATAAALRPGQEVQLHWRHEFVTTTSADGRTAKQFVRRISLLEPLPTAPSRVVDVLAVHDTLATFQGLHAAPCLARSTHCPKHCSHGGDAATFHIKKYHRHEKLGPCGEEQQMELQVLLNDAGPFAETIRSLKPGQPINLHWKMTYVKTLYPDGTESCVPERVIVHLAKAGTRCHSGARKAPSIAGRPHCLSPRPAV
eukprot:EG_transcript_8461